MKIISLVVFVLFAINIGAQDLEWILEPAITDAEEIRVQPISNPLVIVRKKDERGVTLYGVKNHKDELLVPIIHRHLDISTDQQYIYLRKRDRLNPSYILDLKGDTLEYDKYLINKHPWTSTNYFPTRNNLQDFTIKYNLRLESFLTENNWQLHRIKDSKNNTIIDSINGANVLLDEGYVSVRGEKSIELYNKKGKLVYRAEGDFTYRMEGMNYVESNGVGLYAHPNKILNAKFEEVYDAGDNTISLIKGYDLFTVRIENEDNTWDTQIYNTDGEVAVLGKFKKIEQVELDENILYLSQKKQKQIYSLKEHKPIFMTNGTIAKTDMKGWAKITTVWSKNMKCGAFNYEKKQLVLDTIYNSVYSNSSHIVTVEGDENAKVSTVYDREGTKLFSIKDSKVIPRNYNTFFIESPDSINKLVDEKGETIFEVEDDRILRDFNSDWMYSFDVRKNELFYNLKEITEGQINKYQSVEYLRHTSMCRKKMYIVSMDNKYGLYSSGDGIIVPCEYDLIEFNKMARESGGREHTEVINVLKDGKWGAFINPCLY